MSAICFTNHTGLDKLFHDLSEVEKLPIFFRKPVKLSKKKKINKLNNFS